ncbi:LacI family DNA-binding transcriptional regulator [Streptomyces sulfonofaciens]|uniref:LacI family DNA-binding transcriptional regulator n=1 Tax=Streptomyces sulfonofaciens TaxID=68272 RepID=UPI001E6337B3|nr:LacI family DNA-binding transcriptional regulator [Streptomyces sulfonofaciens]
MRQYQARATIKDVAARAGVSPSAVSMALHDRPGVSSATRERILTAARELGWRPNQAAQSLSGRRVHTVGLAIAKPARTPGPEPFCLEFLSGVDNVLIERSCSLLLRLVDADEEVEVHRKWWQEGRVNGSILLDVRTQDARIPALAAIDLPTVVVGHPSLAGPFTSVHTDDEAAAVEAVRHLAALGHRVVAHVGGSPELGRTVLRARAFEDAARRLGLTARSVHTGSSPDEGTRTCRDLMLSRDSPTAVLFDSDITAAAALGVAAESGLRVPQDLSLLAWDDSPLCRLTRPTLSAMRHDVFAFGALAARTLFDVMGGAGHTSHSVRPPTLVPRGSTGPAPRDRHHHACPERPVARRRADPPREPGPCGTGG